MTPPRFDWLAAHYAWVERLTYGGWLHRCRTALLSELTDARRVLILGEGDGRFLADFLRANSVATVDVIDASAGMVALARRRLGLPPPLVEGRSPSETRREGRWLSPRANEEDPPGGFAADLPSTRGGEPRPPTATEGASPRGLNIDRVTWHVADARRFDFPPASYDLVVTNFFLDCFPAAELAPLVGRLARCLMPGGRWLVGDFALPPGGVRRLSARLALAGMYAFFALGTGIRAARLADPTPLLLAEGSHVEREARLLGGFLVSKLWRAPASKAS